MKANWLVCVFWPLNRVTRFGEFSPIGRLFPLGSFLNLCTEVAQIFLSAFYTVNFYKNEWECNILGDCNGHRVRLQNIRSQVRIPPGCKVFRSLKLQCCFQNLCNMHCHCVYLRKTYV
jgi:hypothetical protein